MAGIADSIKQFLVGSPGQLQQFPRLSPQQLNLQQGLTPAINSLLPQATGQGGQGFNFAPIAQQARTQFNTQTIPSLAERFTSLGAQGSSAFQGALGAAGAGLEEGLAGLESKYGLAQQGQQQQLLLALLSMALQPQHENAYFPSRSGLFQGLAGGLGSGLGSLGGLSGLQYLGLL
jgi:hypothetical protein